MTRSDTVSSSVSARASERPDWLPYGQYPFEDRFIEIGGHRIHYVDEGAGPALLLVNAGMWSFVFRDLIVRLRVAFRCVALDFPGLGLSDAASGFEPTLAANSRILESFVDRVGLRDLTMLVHDMGGPVGLALAGRRPELFRALVISQAFAWPLRDYPWVQRALRLVSSGPFKVVNAGTDVLSSVTVTSFGVGRHLSREGRRAFRGPWRRRSARTMTLRILGSGVNCDPWMEGVQRAIETTLKDLPVLTVFGQLNDPFKWQARYGRTFPNSRALTVSRSNHFPFADDPELVATTIASWWRELVAAADDRQRGEHREVDPPTGLTAAP